MGGCRNLEQGELARKNPYSFDFSVKLGGKAYLNDTERKIDAR